MSENTKRLMERWTLFIGGVEMLIGAATAAYPAVFPTWVTYLALAIAAVTIGIGFTLVWTDIRRLAAFLRFSPVWIGPTISLVGIAIIIGLAVKFLADAPEGTFTASPSMGIALLGMILVLAFFLLLPQKNGARTTAELAALTERVTTVEGASIKRQQAGMEAALAVQSLLNKAEGSIDKHAADIAALRSLVEDNLRMTKLSLQMLSQSLRARDALDIITKADAIVVELAGKLLLANEPPYDRPGGWFLQYSEIPH